MPSENTSERRVTKPNQMGSGGLPPPPPEPEQLQCPRCDSTNTKFCYYNNYNFSQPRHFCKSCRRYWTHGGTLRGIPVGGGSRKNAKRSRTIASAASSSSSVLSLSSTTSASEYHHIAATPAPVLAPLSVDHGGAVKFFSDGKNGGNNNVCGSFTSLLNTQGSGLFALGGFGLGLGAGVEDMGFGLGRAVWPFPGFGVGDGGNSGAAGVGGPNVLGNTWQLQSGEAGIVGGDCFISTTGHGMK